MNEPKLTEQPTVFALLQADTGTKVKASPNHRDIFSQPRVTSASPIGELTCPPEIGPDLK